MASLIETEHIRRQETKESRTSAAEQCHTAQWGEQQLTSSTEFCGLTN